MKKFLFGLLVSGLIGVAGALAASAFILRMFERAPTSDAPVIAAPPAAPPVPGTHSIRSG